MRRRAALVPVTMVCCGVVAVAAWATLAGRAAQADPAPAIVAPAVPVPAVNSIDAPTGLNLRRTVTVQVVQKTKDAVVNISAKKLVARRVSFGPFWQAFDNGQVVHVPADSLGSGFIVHRDGYVVTNNHVIDHARQISVELSNGDSLPADLISADPDADLAVLRIHGKAPLPTLDLGESRDLMIGEPVIAVGNPLGFSHSVSTGIVSALHRDIDPKKAADDQPGGDAQPVKGEEAALRDLIQTDAAINPGNSGGPLLNAYGQVIGINTAIRSDAQNIGFAIPIDRLRDLIPELMNPSQVTKVDVPLHLAERRTIDEPATVTTQVVSAGTETAAVVRSIDGRPPANIIDAYAQLLDLRANQPFDVAWADGRRQRLVTRPTPMPDAVVQARQRFGLQLVQLTPMLADKDHLAPDLEDGLFVTGVDRDTPAGRADVRPGDVIVQFGSVRLATLDDFGALVDRLPATGTVRVWLIRGTTLGYVTVRF